MVAAGSQFEASEFPAMAQVAAILDALEGHRQRQAFAFLAERYGWNLAPSPRKVSASMNPNNRSEFPAIEQAAELLDGLEADHQRQAIALLAARYQWKVAASYKSPARGFALKRKYTKR